MTAIHTIVQVCFVHTFSCIMIACLKIAHRMTSAGFFYTYKSYNCSKKIRPSFEGLVVYLAIASAGAFSGSQPVKPVSGIAFITAMSSAESSKSKICAFSIILAGVTDFVRTLRPD